MKMKMEKEEKMTTADPKATKETVELWHYLHAVAGKQIITGRRDRLHQAGHRKGTEAAGL